jgi:hypothetical protein
MQRGQGGAWAGGCVVTTAEKALLDAVMLESARFNPRLPGAVMNCAVVVSAEREAQHPLTGECKQAWVRFWSRLDGDTEARTAAMAHAQKLEAALRADGVSPSIPAWFDEWRAENEGVATERSR